MTPLFLEQSYDSGFWEDVLFLGLIAQFLVGCTQLLFGILRTISAFSAKENMKVYYQYWIMVVTYFSILYVLTHYSPGWSMVFLPSAWIIAVWYCIKIAFNKSLNSQSI